MIRCIIVDDELQSRLALKDALQEYAATIKIIAEANSVTTAVEVINNFQPDLLFLDIQLGDGSGFDVLEQITWQKSKTVFVTAYIEYAIQAFRVNAMDYLLKPISNQQLAEAITRINAVDNNIHSAQLQQLMQQLNNQSKKISFSTSEGYSLYDVDDIIRCESSNNYCTVFFKGNEKLFIAKTLKELDEQLTKHGFERVHQSHLINMKHVKKYINKEGGMLMLDDGTHVPVSQRKKTQLIQLLQEQSV